MEFSSHKVHGTVLCRGCGNIIECPYINHCALNLQQKELGTSSKHSYIGYQDLRYRYKAWKANPRKKQQGRWGNLDLNLWEVVGSLSKSVCGFGWRRGVKFSLWCSNWINLSMLAPSKGTATTVESCVAGLIHLFCMVVPQNQQFD